MKKILLPLVFAISLNSSYAQKEGNIWYFGNAAGMDFNGGAPVALNNGQLYTTEGSAAISDANGNLLFYTEGVNVYNRNHVLMPNGGGLMGGTSASQSAIVLPDPASTNQYYIFTVPNTASGALRYSIVDMTLDGGNGDITAVKNVSLAGVPVAEKLTATHHRNGTDFWVAAHGNMSDNFYAYQVSATGVTGPIVSSIGTIHNGINPWTGCMKFSPEGDKMAVCLYGTQQADLLDFDNLTGVFSNSATYNFPTTFYSYGVEFSKSGNVLYICNVDFTPGQIYQYDMLAGNNTDILATGQIIYDNPLDFLGSLQLGPDDKVYYVRYGYNYASAIEFPEVLGPGCTPNDIAVPLGTGVAQLGLPDFIAGYTSTFQPVAGFVAPNHLCPGTCTDFQNNSSYATSWLWSFPGGNPAVSTDEHPIGICYNTPGNYPVTLIASNSAGGDTLTLNNYITVYPSPAPQGINQSGDTLIANQGAVSYQWYHDGVLIPGATDYFYVADASGNFNVVATDANGCEVEAVIFDVIAGLTPPDSYRDLSEGEGVTAFPNPVKNLLTIQLTVKSKSAIKIYNCLGEIVMEKNLSENISGTEIQIDCSSYPEGIYIIEITKDNLRYRERFVKQ